MNASLCSAVARNLFDQLLIDAIGKIISAGWQDSILAHIEEDLY